MAKVGYDTPLWTFIADRHFLAAIMVNKKKLTPGDLCIACGNIHVQSGVFYICVRSYCEKSNQCHCDVIVAMMMDPHHVVHPTFAFTVLIDSLVEEGCY